MTNSIEFYLGFDGDFFHTTKAFPPEEEKEAELSQLSERYTSLLEDHRETLEAVLSNQAQPEEIPTEFFTELIKLTKREKKHEIMLRKRKSKNPLEVSNERLCECASVSLTTSQQWYIGSYVYSHLARLILPIEYSFDDFISRREGIHEKMKYGLCESFGKEFIRYLSTIFYTDPEGYIGDSCVFMKTVCDPDSSQQLAYWTLAPYIHADLKQRGLTPNQSMEKLFQWARDSVHESPFPRRPDFVSLNHTFFGQFGISEWENQLGYDERMPSHLLANICAKAVARELYQE